MPEDVNPNGWGGRAQRAALRADFEEIAGLPSATSRPDPESSRCFVSGLAPDVGSPRCYGECGLLWVSEVALQVLSEWGLAGIAALHEHVGVLVIVDVLSFSTAVDVAVSRGAIVYPFSFVEEQGARFAAERVGALLARPRRSAGAKYSLSPVSLLSIPAGTKLMLPSLNGSRLCVVAGRTTGRIPVLTGCLRNARAVAAVARAIAGNKAIGVVPAGERWPDGSLRPAVEDLLGAGAIVDHLDWPCSPEAQVARDAYRTAGRDIDRLIRLSLSGRELVDAGYSGDVDLALDQDASTTVPVLTDGAFQQVT